MAGYQVIDNVTGEDHGIWETLERARGCIEFDRLKYYDIWHGDELIEYHDEPPPNTDPENIYGSASMRQSIEEDRK